MSVLKPLTAAGKGNVAVILPDTVSSARYTQFDAPYLTQALTKAGLSSSQFTVQNAQGSDATELSDAQTAITKGASVLIMDPLDSGVGAQIESYAKAHGVGVVDYDRLTLGGSRAYYVSFNNVLVGTKIGQGFTACAASWHVAKPNVLVMKGAPTDNNATLFAQGYNSILDPLYADGTYTKGLNQSVPKWDNAQAGTIFEQMLTSASDIKGALVANDGMANAVIAVLKKDHLQMPVTGQDATVQGLQHILDGDQCMTVYKAVKKEAQAASDLAIALAKGSKPTAPTTVKDTTLNKDVPSVLATPVAIYKDNVKDVVNDGYVTKADLCTGDYAAKCTAAGIS
jgi:D-xylose transport system substrate-binding protein